MEVPKNLEGFVKTWHVKYSAEQHSKCAISCGFFPTYIHFHTIPHVYRDVWPTREAKPHFGARLVHSVHDCETGLYQLHQQ